MRIRLVVTVAALAVLSGCGADAERASRSKDAAPASDVAPAATADASEFTDEQLERVRRNHADWQACLDNPRVDALLCTDAFADEIASRQPDAEASFTCDEWGEMSAGDRVAYAASWYESETGRDAGFGVKSDLVSGTSSACREFPGRPVDDVLGVAAREFGHL